MTKDPNKIGLFIIIVFAVIGLLIGLATRPKLPDTPKESLSLPAAL